MKEHLDAAARQKSNLPQRRTRSVDVPRKWFHISGTDVARLTAFAEDGFVSFPEMPDTLEDRILKRVHRLRPSTTMCPGRLSKDLGFKLADLRATYLVLAAAGRLSIRQGGRPTNLQHLRGPFRIGPP